MTASRLALESCRRAGPSVGRCQESVEGLRGIALGRGDSPLSQPMVELKLYPLHGRSLLYISLAASFPWLTILDWSCGLDRLEQFRR